MRYSDRVIFVTESEGGFNPDTGNHDEAVQVKETKPCNITPVGTERSVQLFGEIDTNIIVSRLQRPYNRVIDYVVIPSGQYKGRYRVKEHIKHRKQSVFYLEGAAL